MTLVDDALRDDLYKCNKCGFCQAACATYRVTGDEIVSGRGLLRLARDAFEGRIPWSQGLARRMHDCLLCQACTSTCPSGAPAQEILLATRQELAQRGLLPESLAELRDEVATSGTTEAQPGGDRLAWTRNLEPDVPVGGTHQIAYYVGCVASADPELWGIPQSMARLLTRAGADYGLLEGGGDCCGYPLVAMGDRDSARELARANVDRVRSMGASILLTTCAAGYRMWSEHVPELLGEELGFRVRHAIQWLAESDLEWRRLDATVTYHDACHLGRGSGIYDPPRDWLRSIPGLDLAEMAYSRGEAICCGAGGVMDRANPLLAQEVGALRAAQAEATGAQLLVTACAKCRRALSSTCVDGIRVVDAVELAAELLP